MDNHKRYYPQSLSYDIYDNAIVIPASHPYGGVVDKYGNFIKQSGITEEWIPCSLPEECKIKYIDEEVLYIGWIYPVFGHVITDGIKKLWFLQSIYTKLFSNYKEYVYIAQWRGDDIPNYINELFLYLGIDLKLCKHIETPTRFKKVIVPNNSFIIKDRKHYWTIEFQKTIQTIIQNIKPELQYYPRKIYLTRSKLKQGRREFSEERSIENIFKHLGYKIISPEKLNIGKQIELLQHCEYLATTEGSISHLAVFCRPNTNIVILKKSNEENDYQLAINDMVSNNITYLNTHHSIYAQTGSMAWAGPFYVYPSNELRHWAGIRKSYYPVWLRPKFLWYCIRIKSLPALLRIKRVLAGFFITLNHNKS